MMRLLLLLCQLVSFAAPEDTAPWSISFSGGGLRAQSATFGVLKSLRNISQIDTISSVSGGTWGLSQYLYDQQFHAAVLSNDSPNAFFRNFILKTLPSEIWNLKLPGHHIWEKAVKDYYNAHSKDKTLADLEVTPANRLDNRAEIMFLASLPQQGLMADGSISTIEPRSKSLEGILMLPFAWRIPSTGNGSWGMPFAPLHNLMVQNSGRTAPLTLPLIPSMSKIGGMSSAAEGFNACPNLSKETTIPPAKAASDMDLAVCSGSETACSFPSFRVIDGAYADNTGAAMLIGRLQTKHPSAGTLKVFAVVSDPCEPSSDPGCAHGITVNSRKLFANATNATTTQVMKYQFSSISHQIFAEELSLVQAECGGHPLPSSPMTYMAGLFTTVDNQFFGVKRGTKVQLVVLNVNSPLGTGPNPRDLFKFGSLADEAHRVSELLVHKYLGPDAAPFGTGCA